MGFDDAEDFVVGDRFLHVIRGAHLHSLEIAIHIRAACEDHRGQPPVDLKDAFKNGSPFKRAASLLDQNEIVFFFLDQCGTLGRRFAGADIEGRA